MTPADKYATSLMTVYGAGAVDKYGNSTVALKGVINCEHKSGGQLRTDQNGTQFVAKSVFYPVEDGFTVDIGDYVVLGDTSASTYIAAKAHEVRDVQRSDQSYFGWDDAVEVFT